jgi:hypothetical protein
VNDEFYLDGSGHGLISGNIPVFATNTMKKRGQDSCSPDRDLNPEPYKSLNIGTYFLCNTDNL